MSIPLKKIKSLSIFFAVLIGTAGGAGLLPLAPGTWGTLVAIPISCLTNHWDWTLKLAFWILVTIVGTWASKVIVQKFGKADNQSIVIDEVIGFGISAWTAGQNYKALAVAFILFRIFDVVKIPPVRQVDRWSKRVSGRSKWVGGFGVIADDILAGIQALAVILVLQSFGVLS